MSRQRPVTQSDAEGNRLLVARGLLLRRGEGRGAYYEPARKERAVARFGKRTPVSMSKPADSARRAPGSRKSKDKKGRAIPKGCKRPAVVDFPIARCRGTNRVIEMCQKHGAPPPVFEEKQGFLVVTFRVPLVAGGNFKGPGSHGFRTARVAARVTARVVGPTGTGFA
jgi:hypothetical protein